MDDKDVIIQDLRADKKKLTEELEQLKKQKAAVDTNIERLTIQYDNCFVPKRLCTIDRNGDADDCDTCADACNMTSGECDKCPIQKCFDKLAQYEDLEEQGLLLKLPCSVGTQVFIINHYWIDEGFICGIAEADDIDCFCFKVYVDPDTYTLIAIDDFEKGWFLTEQEAQAALEKMKGE